MEQAADPRGVAQPAAIPLRPRRHRCRRPLTGGESARRADPRGERRARQPDPGPRRVPRPRRRPRVHYAASRLPGAARHHRRDARAPQRRARSGAGPASRRIAARRRCQQRTAGGALTLDAGLQAFVTEVLARRLGSLSARNVRDSAAVVVDTASGDILANVGSAGSASRSGAVDGAAAPRQAGSTLEPFVYGLALERRLLTAASVLDDSPVDLDAASGSTSRRIMTVSFADRSASARRSAAASTSPPSARCCSSASMRCANDYTRAATAASRATAVITVSASRSVRLK